MSALAHTHESIKVKINGQEFEAEKGEYILDLARRNRILIPSFCHHEALAGLGCCRVCVVEVNEGGKPRVVVSCVYPLSKDCEVNTESDKIKRIRRNILSMLKCRAPMGNRLASLCGMYKVPENKRFTVPKDEKCILCGLCVEACAKLGTGAISSVGRGVGKKISTPYDEASRDCLGCGSCAAVCPTGAIECTEAEGVRSIWGKTFKLLRCASCGKPFATGEEIAHARVKTGAAETLCESCRRKKGSDVLAGVFGIRV
jgi:NADH dehydrogenase/NADH:ubiquinone oxidoreductase subunit G